MRNKMRKPIKYEIEFTADSKVEFNHNDLKMYKGIKAVVNKGPTPLNYTTIVICKKGKVKCNLGGKEIQYQAGDIIFASSRLTLQDTHMSASASIDTISFKDFLAYQFLVHTSQMNLLKSKMLEDPVISLNKQQQQYIYTLFDTIYDMVSNKLFDGRKAYAIKKMLEAFIAVVMTIYQNREVPEEDTPIKGIHGEELAKRFYMMVNDQNNHERNVAEYAKLLNITPKYLAILVRRYMGKAPLEVITEITLDRIKSELQFSTKSVKEIAYSLRFDNLSFFGKYVKKHLGVSPQRYRNQYLREHSK